MTRDEIHEIMRTAAQDLGEGMCFSGTHNEKLIRLAGLALLGLDAMQVPEVE